MTVKPKALARNATAEPILPRPTIPNEAKGSISHFFDSIARHITYCNAKFTSCFDIDVVYTGTNSNNDSKRLKLLQIFLRQNYLDCASQKATVATSLRMGISIEQSRPSRSATSGRVWIGPLAIGPLKFSIRGRLGIIFRLSIDKVEMDAIPQTNIRQCYSRGNILNSAIASVETR
ncbi:hypothetical protein ALC53_08462 [Atta colombica]|uniref:Uncharacterized protein n=1 Tax=Atta colombica TaxID=520822 RepID=A0A195BA99_9HYME|nr:hypothetical protein ALC53_08462 [Atta colombica]